MHPNGLLARRWNFAGALQPTGTKKLSDGPAVIAGFVRRFAPERVRAVILSPDRFGNTMPLPNLMNLTTTLRNVPGAEVSMTDATTRTGNGMMYADFFDFT